MWKLPKQQKFQLPSIWDIAGQKELIEKINSGIFPLKDEPGYEEIFHNVLKDQKFTVTTNIAYAVPK